MEIKFERKWLKLDLRAFCLSQGGITGYDKLLQRPHNRLIFCVLVDSIFV